MLANHGATNALVTRANEKRFQLSRLYVAHRDEATVNGR